ncbi:MAG: 4-(cytidine 5'-diphospho)-2-C-methyl-D-erythritol kinase [Parvularculaceae bacterium]
MIAERASAKINLYLHVGPLRRDRLHDLASLFVFAHDGDVIRVEPAAKLSLNMTGPFAGELAGLSPEKNLVFRAAKELSNACGVKTGAAITLEKNLPIASGVGGGSADAAAALRALIKLWNARISDDALAKLAFSLGADVPACLKRSPVNVSGAGERLTPGPALPPLWVTLVNPGVDMPTGPVFRAFDARYPSPPAPSLARLYRCDYEGVKAMMRTTRNDLESVAIARAPVIADVIASLAAAPGALGARMSGSGATCFALFSSAAAASRAARAATGRGWWAMASALHVR